MSSDLDLLITVGHDITSIKYYALATCTILFYDYFLTLADEIKYAWSGGKSWMFWLFIVNRYFPMGYQIWLLGLSYSPHFSTQVYEFQRRALDDDTVLTSPENRCDKTAFISIFSFVVCTLLAQAVLTLRVYAVTSKNILIATGFVAITASQLALGIYLVTFAARDKGQPLPHIPFDAYHLCVFVRHRTLEIAYTSISLLYDFLAFSLITFMALRWQARRLGIRTLMGTIAEDSMWYFLVIFSSHFVLEMTLLLGRTSIQLLPASGNVVYLPVMISRLMLSLKKAADSSRDSFSGEPSTNLRNFRSIRFFRFRKGTTGREDEIPLDTRTGRAY